MYEKRTKFSSVDEYIASFSGEVKKRLKYLRTLIKKIAPEAVERISYNMPAFEQYGILLYYAGFKNHIGFYALSSGNKEFQKELKNYKTGKGSIQFPHDEHCLSN